MSTETKRGTRLDTAEKKEIALLRAQGKSYYAIGRIIGRSEHTVKKALEEPDVACDVRSNQVRLADKYQELAERIVDAVTPEDIEKASLQQMATASGIFLDKSRLLRGESTDNVGLMVRLVREACESAPLPPCPVLPDGSNLTEAED